MKLNPLGRTGLFVSELCLGTMTFGGGDDGIWGKIGTLAAGRRPSASSAARSTPASTSSTPPTSTPEGGRSRSPARRSRTSSVPRESVVVATKVFGADGPGRRTTRGASRYHIIDALQGEPEAAAARPHRPLPDPRLRPGDADRGDAARARHSRAARPRPLRRRLELGGVADHEGARHLRAARPRALRDAAGLLHDRRPRPRARDRADAAERGRRPDGLEPARRRPALRQVRPRRQRARRQPPRQLRLPAGRQATAPTTAIDAMRDDRRGARRLGRADRARLAAAPAGGDQRDHRRQARRAARRQPRRDRASRSTADELAALDEVSALPAEYPGWMFARQGEYRRKQIAEARRPSLGG